jgi:hypothetical protein
LAALTASPDGRAVDGEGRAAEQDHGQHCDEDRHRTLIAAASVDEAGGHSILISVLLLRSMSEPNRLVIGVIQWWV